MSRKTEEPLYSVRRRVNLTLRADQVEHAIRCWLLNTPHLPQPKDFSGSVVRVFATEEGVALNATLTYEPVEQEPRA